MYNFFTSYINIEDSKVIRRLILLNSFLLIAIFAALLFALFNFFIIEVYSVGIMNIVAFILALGMLLDLRWNKNLKRVTYVSIVGITTFFLIFIYINKNDGYGLFWAPLVPVFIIGLIGAKKGALITLIFLSIVFLFAYSGVDQWQNGMWSLMGFVRLVASSIFMTMIVVMMDIALEESYKKFEILSTIDSLTSVNNRRNIQEIMKVEMQRAKRYSTELGIILFDIDNFKKINDKQGHNAGDKVLINLTKEVVKSLRSSDSIGRLGGEEFLVVIPEISKEGIDIIAEKLRVLVNDMPCEVVKDLSCSFGVALFDKNRDTIETFIDRADKAMYKAKNMGKNRVEYL